MFTNKDLKKLILPLIIEQILLMLVGMADTIMVSYVGEAAISGVALVDMINNLVITVLTAIATGGAVIVSQYLGSRRQSEANDAASQLILIAAIISCIIMALSLLLHRSILGFLFGAVETEVMEAAITYFIISALSFPFLGIYNASSAIFRSMRRTEVTMKVSLLMNSVNIIGNALGIFYFRAGVAGIAAATLISRILAAIIMLALAFQERNQVSVSWKKICMFNRNVINRILKIAAPNGIENGLFMLGKVLVTSIVALFGTSQIAANGVANSMINISSMVVNAINLAIVTVVGQCIGAREYEQASGYTKKLMLVSYGATAVLGLAVWLLLPFLLGMYELSPETYRLSYYLILSHNILALLLHPTSFNLPNSLRASGDVRFTMYTGIGSMVVFRLGTAFLLGIIMDLGVVGVWAAMGMDWLARSVAFTWRYKTGKWKEFRVI